MADDLKVAAPSGYGANDAVEARAAAAASHAEAWHAASPAAAVKALSSDLRAGLAETEAEARRARYGPNQLEATGKVGPFTIFARQFANALVIILAAAALLSVFMGHWGDPDSQCGPWFCAGMARRARFGSPAENAVAGMHGHSRR